MTNDAHNKLATSTNETCTERTFSSGCSRLQQSATELLITNSLPMFRCICFNSLQHNCRSPTVCQCSAVSVSTVCNAAADYQQFAMFRCICFNSLQQNCRSPTVCQCSAVSVSTVCNAAADYQQFAMFRCICFNSLQQNCRLPTVCRCSAVSVSTTCKATADHQQSANGQHHRNITPSEFLADASRASGAASRGCQ